MSVSFFSSGLGESAECKWKGAEQGQWKPVPLERKKEEESQAS